MSVRASRCLLFVALLLMCFSVAEAEETTPLKFFDGTPKVLVAHGYSTSFHWPQILQLKLDRYFDGKRVLEVQLAVKGGTPIAKWMNVETGERAAAWKEILKPKLQRSDNRPTIILAQQSLQWVFGQREAGIRGPEDKERITKGADALETYAKALLEDGADAVFIAMHIYKHPMEPEIGNERLALAELQKRQIPHVYPGPDVWEATKPHYPRAFDQDRMHPNQMGAEIMAQKWFERLLHHDGLEVPTWSRKEMTGANPLKPERSQGLPR